MLTNKTDLLDPLSVIVKLFIYSHKKTGTKISVQNNRVTIQENWVLFQSAMRTIMRDSKNDLNILYNPIIHACEIYLNSGKREEYKELFETTAIAFLKLKETYAGTEIVYTIENIEKSVNSFLLDEEHSITKEIKTSNNPSFKKKLQIYQNIGKVWTKNKLNILFGFLNEIKEATTDEEIEFILVSLSTYMDYIDLCASKSIIKFL